MDIVVFIIGAVITLFTWATLLATFVLPRGRSIYSAPSRLVSRFISRVFVWGSHLCPTFNAKDSLLAVVGPMALLAQLALILGSIVVGFAFMDNCWAHGMSLAFGQSAAAVFTLGLDRISGSTNDVVLVLAAASGAIAIALQIGYLPTIYQSFARRETLVTLMESRAGVPAWGPEVLMRHLFVSTLDALPDLYKSWEGWAAEVAESHTTQPVLMYFRSPEPGFSWVLALLAILDAASLHLAVMPEAAPSEAKLCLRMGFTCLRRLASTLGWEVDPDPHPDNPIELEYAAFEAVIDQLERYGFPLERTTTEAWPHFKGWRVNYETLAYRFADYLVAPHAPWSGPRSHLSDALMLPDRPPHRNPNGDLVFDAQLREERAAARRHLMRFFGQVFVTLLVIMDPIGNAPIFLILSAERSAKERRRLSWQAVAVAGGVIGTFALFGQQILEYLGITIPAIQGSGGLLLFLVALELLIQEVKPPADHDEVNVALVPLGTPLIAGPGAIAAIIVFVREAHGSGEALAIVGALALVLALVYLALRFSLQLTKLLRPGGIHVLTRIFGLLLSAIAVQLIAESIRGFVNAH